MFCHADLGAFDNIQPGSNQYENRPARQSNVIKMPSLTFTHDVHCAIDRRKKISSFFSKPNQDLSE